MKFMSGAKLNRFKFVVPFFKLNDQTIVHNGRFLDGTTFRVERPIGSPLKAHFQWGNGHIFDSEKAQQENSWDDEARQIVEFALLNPNNNYFKKVDGRGIWPIGDQEIPEPSEIEVKEQYEMPASTPCITLLEDNTRCPNPAVPGNFNCEEHLDMGALAPDLA